MTQRRFQWSVRTLMACTFIVASACAALVALRFDLYFTPFVFVPSFLGVMLLLTRNGLLVSSVGCVLSLVLVVVGGDHVRGPICILAWYTLQQGVADPLIEFVVISMVPAVAVVSSCFVTNDRIRAILCGVGVIGLFGVWTWLTLISVSLGWEYLASLPLFVCLIWRAAFDARSLLAIAQH